MKTRNNPQARKYARPADHAERAMLAAELLVHAYDAGDERGGSIDWSDLDAAYAAALEVTGRSSGSAASDAPANDPSEHTCEACGAPTEDEDLRCQHLEAENGETAKVFLCPGCFRTTDELPTLAALDWYLERRRDSAIRAVVNYLDGDKKWDFTNSGRPRSLKHHLEVLRHFLNTRYAETSGETRDAAASDDEAA